MSTDEILQADLAAAREECERLRGEHHHQKQRAEQAEARAEAAVDQLRTCRDHVSSGIIRDDIDEFLRHASGDENNDPILGTFDPKVRRKEPGVTLQIQHKGTCAYWDGDACSCHHDPVLRLVEAAQRVARQTWAGTYESIEELRDALAALKG